METRISKKPELTTIYQGKFLRIDHDVERSIAYNVWLPETREMSDDDFKQEISQWVNQAILKGFKYTLANTLDFRFIITPQLNEWYNKMVTPPAFAAGVVRLAFLLPDGVFAQMSIANIFEEGYEKNAMTIRYFNNEAEAVQWLLSE